MCQKMGHPDDISGRGSALLLSIQVLLVIMGSSLPSETTTTNNGKLLSEKELDDYFQQYEDWATGEDQDEVPILEEEDFHMICDIIEDLFEHIRCQKDTIADLAEIGRSIKALGGTLRKDVDSLKKLKRKATRSVEEEDGFRVKRVRKHISRK